VRTIQTAIWLHLWALVNQKLALQQLEHGRDPDASPPVKLTSANKMHREKSAAEWHWPYSTPHTATTNRTFERCTQDTCTRSPWPSSSVQPVANNKICEPTNDGRDRKLAVKI